jgi:hypothetical protein
LMKQLEKRGGLSNQAHIYRTAFAYTEPHLKAEHRADDCL